MNWRTVLGAVLVVFILYAIYTEPAKSADAAAAIWRLIAGGLTALFKFFSDLINR